MRQPDPRTAPSMFTRGAVDLGALRDRATAQAASPGQPPASASGVAIDVTETTFQSEVMQRSLSTPVLVLFTTEWAAEAAEFQASLERLAVESNGGFILARVDVEKEPRLAGAFRVQAVPTIFAVIGGQPMEGFAGVAPDAQLKQFVDAIIKAGGGELPPEPVDPRMQEAEEALADERWDDAIAGFSAILADSPGDALAQSGLSEAELLRRLADVDPRTALSAAEANPDDVAAQTLAADVEVISGFADQGYARLVDLVRRTSGDERDKARTHLITLLALAAPDDPVAAKARRALASALF